MVIKGDFLRLERKGYVKTLIFVAVLAALFSVMLLFVRIQYSKELTVSRSVTSSYSILHAYKRAKLATSLSLNSILENTSVELGKNGGNVKGNWKNQIPHKENLKDGFKNTLDGKLGTALDGKYFPEQVSKTGVVMTNLEKWDSNLEENQVSFFLHFSSQSAENFPIKAIRLEDDLKMTKELPSRYLESGSKVIEYLNKVMDVIQREGWKKKTYITYRNKQNCKDHYFNQFKIRMRGLNNLYSTTLLPQNFKLETELERGQVKTRAEIKKDPITDIYSCDISLKKLSLPLNITDEENYLPYKSNLRPFKFQVEYEKEFFTFP